MKGGDYVAVSKVPGTSVLKLVLDTGQVVNGNPVLRTRSINGIKSTAADQDLFDAAQALAGLQQYTLNAVRRVDNSTLINA
jgi:hypothetical protein